MREIKFRAFVKKDKAMVSDVRIGDSLNDCFKSDGVVFMQFTGLKDVNGVEIYEGDVVEFGAFGEAGAVEYKNDSASYVCELFESGRVVALADHLMFGDKHTSRKVIGNIHQNSDLLS